MPSALVHRVYMNAFQGTAFLNPPRPEQRLEFNPNAIEKLN